MDDKCLSCKGTGKLQGMGFVIKICKTCNGSGKRLSNKHKEIILDLKAEKIIEEAKAEGIELVDQKDSENKETKDKSNEPKKRKKSKRDVSKEDKVSDS